MANYNLTAQHRRAYQEQSRRYAVESTAEAVPPWIDLPESLKSDSLRGDISALSAFATGTPSDKTDTLSDRIFGSHLGKARMDARHVGYLLVERWHLYQIHLQEIADQTNDIKSRLAILRRPYHIHPPQLALGLDRMLLQLQDQQRKEQLAFWKDSSELRDRLLEAATEYRTVRGRASLLGNRPEDSDG